jgi:hypothetical protein
MAGVFSDLALKILLRVSNKRGPQTGIKGNKIAAWQKGVVIAGMIDLIPRAGLLPLKFWI